jgi:hypothetical protein
MNPELANITQNESAVQQAFNKYFGQGGSLGGSASMASMSNTNAGPYQEQKLSSVGN